jgi:hypothetical protein
MGLACRREEEVEAGVAWRGILGLGGDVGCRIWEAVRWRVREMAAGRWGAGELERGIAGEQERSLLEPCILLVSDTLSWGRPA